MTWVLAGYGVTAGVLALYALWLVLRARALARKGGGS